MTDFLADRPSVQQIIDIAREHGAISVKVFGSRSRGDARPDSDLDLLVEVAPGTSLFDLIRMETRLADFLGVEVEVVTPGGLHPRMKDEIINEARPLVVAA